VCACSRFTLLMVGSSHSLPVWALAVAIIDVMKVMSVSLR
jgi:hypothetical protein